jgi:hypothetical protein
MIHIITEINFKSLSFSFLPWELEEPIAQKSSHIKEYQ